MKKIQFVVSYVIKGKIMPTLYHLSPENFDFFSPERTGKNFTSSKFHREPGTFFAPNMRSALAWANAIAGSKGYMSAGYSKLLKQWEKELKKEIETGSEINKKHPFLRPNPYKTLYLYKVLVNRNDLERWKEKESSSLYSYFEPEIFIPARDFNKIQIIGKNEYLTSELENKYNIEQLRPKAKGYEEHLLQNYFGEEEAEKIKEKKKQEEELKTPEFFDDLLKQNKEERKRKKREEEIKERFSFTNNINWYKIAKNINGEF